MYNILFDVSFQANLRSGSFYLFLVNDFE